MFASQSMGNVDQTPHFNQRSFHHGWSDAWHMRSLVLLFAVNTGCARKAEAKAKHVALG